jgi:hypothetical protein
MNTPTNASSPNAQNGATASNIIATAEAQKGSYAGVNKFNSWYGMPGTEWCDEFVSWVFNQNGALSAIGGKFALTTAHAAWFKAKGQWTDTNPQPGYLAFFNWAGGGPSAGIASIDHVGIVTGTNGTGGVTTVEGNTGNNTVADRVRVASNIVGYGIPTLAGMAAGTPATNAGFQTVNGLSDVTGVLSSVEKVAGHLVNPQWWGQVGLFGLGILIIAIGVVFFNRQKVQQAAMLAGKAAMI